MRVLLVEDDPKDVRSFKKLLADAGIDGLAVEVAPTLHEAIQKIVSDHFDIALLDLELPDSHGLDTLDVYLRKGAGVPVIVFSDFSAGEIGDEVVRRGAQDYISRGRADGPLVARVMRYAIERNITRKALRESERSLLTLFSNLPGFAYRCQNDEKWTMKFMSEGCREVTGYLPKDFIDNATIAYADIINPDDREYVWDMVQEQVRKKLAFQMTYRIRTRDGRERWMWEKGMPVFTDSGELFLEGFISDITERERAAEEARETARKLEDMVALLDKRNRMMMSMLEDVEAGRKEVTAERTKLSTAVEAMAEGIILLNSRGEVVLSNRAVAMIADLPGPKVGREDLVSSGWFPFEDIRDSVFIRRETLHRDVITRKKPLCVVHVVAIPITRSEGGHDCLVTLQEVTRQRELDQAKAELVTTVSHELRTPLSLIKLCLSNAMAGVMGECSARMSEGLKRADMATDRLKILIEGLLEHSRVTVMLKEASVKGMVEDIREVYDQSMVAKGREFTVEVDVRDDRLIADPQRIHQVVANLLDNDVKFTSEGGHIDLSVTDTEDEVTFRITDDGIGIPREYHAEIFERFRQLGREYGPGTKGLGLGLALCKEIVEKHGGRIWVESTPGHGATFTFTLPRKGPAASEEA